MSPTKTCEFCDKRGLPLLLVRHAIAPANSGAPLASSLPIELSPSSAHYTKRLLRSGYVNVFDEARQRWDAYFVTPDGFLFKLLQTPGIAPIVPKKPFNCPDEGHRAVASCITIPDPLNASKVWIGFSDVLWTDAVRKRNEEATYRSRHMTEIDVKACLKGSQNPHQPIAQVAATVAEYAINSSRAKSSFDSSPFTFSVRQGQSEQLRKECEGMRPGKGLIVTLPDPAGLAQELAFLMKHNAESFISKRPDDKRKMAASLAIDQIKTAVCARAEELEIAGSEEIADQRIAEDPLGHWMSSATRAKTEKIRNVNAAQLKRVATDAWTKYAGKFSNEHRMAWLQNFKHSLKDFDEAHIAPLVAAHVAWMKSASLSAYFECNYDQKNLESGKVFTTIFNHCVQATQDKKACSDLYEEWLKGDIADPKNLLLRALVLNQSPIIDAVKSAVAVSVDLRQIPWDNLFGVHDAAVGRIESNAHDIAAKLLVQNRWSRCASV